VWFPGIWPLALLPSPRCLFCLLFVLLLVVASHRIHWQIDRLIGIIVSSVSMSIRLLIRAASGVLWQRYVPTTGRVVNRHVACTAASWCSRSTSVIRMSMPLLNTSCRSQSTSTSEQQHIESDVIRGCIKRVIFHSETTGYTVLSLRTPTQRKPHTVVCCMPTQAARVGEYVEVHGGVWSMNQQYGRQLKANSITVIRPTDSAETEKVHQQ
jgi:hypothetical protein